MSASAVNAESVDALVVGAGPTGLACGIELQRRGVYRTAYEPGTLREKLFGRGPRLPDTHRAARFRRLPVSS